MKEQDAKKCPVCLSAGRISLFVNGACPKCGLKESHPPAEHEHGSDPCMCGDYRSQHPNNGPCSICANSLAPYDGCKQFRFTRHATETELAHWNKFHLPRLKADHMGNSIVVDSIPKQPEPASAREPEVWEANEGESLTRYTAEQFYEVYDGDRDFEARRCVCEIMEAYASHVTASLRADNERLRRDMLQTNKNLQKELAELARVREALQRIHGDCGRILSAEIRRCVSAH